MFDYSFITRKTEKVGYVGIYVRITIQESRAEISLKRTVATAKWDAASGRVKGNTAEAKEINQYLEAAVVTLHQRYRELSLKNRRVTVEALKRAFQGESVTEHTVLVVFTQHIEQLSKRVAIDYALGTVKRYESCKVHLERYFESRKIKDMYFEELNPAFIQDFEIYLKTQRECQHNTVHKYLSILKKVVRLAVANEWTTYNAFNHFKLSFEETTPVHLTIEELRKIEKKKLPIVRLQQVRDIFLFSCYTGLAYADAAKLGRGNILTDAKGNQRILVARTKTKTQCEIPLLPIPLAILERYRSKVSGSLLPVVSNQKMNAYLKEIADLSGISKRLTTHVARHTFATTVTLTNGVPLETVSRLLGHKNILQTQHYARIVDQKVMADMQVLEKRLGKMKG